MSNKMYHHIAPRTYLNSWIDCDFNELWYLKIEGGYIDKKGSKKIGGKKHFYSFSFPVVEDEELNKKANDLIEQTGYDFYNRLFLEDHLSMTVENDFGKIKNNLLFEIGKGNYPFDDKEIKIIMDKMILVQFTRSKVVRNVFHILLTSFVKYVTRLTPFENDEENENINGELSEIINFMSKLFHNTLVYLIEQFQDELKNYSYCIFENHDGSFLTSDSPVIFNYNEKSFVFPLSPNYLLVLKKCEEKGIYAINQEDIKKFNSLQYSSGAEFIFSNSKVHLEDFWKEMKDRNQEVPFIIEIANMISMMFSNLDLTKENPEEHFEDVFHSTISSYGFETDSSYPE